MSVSVVSDEKWSQDEKVKNVITCDFPGKFLKNFTLTHPIEVHFRNQRIKEALHTKFGANRNNPPTPFQKLQCL